LDLLRSVTYAPQNPKTPHTLNHNSLKFKYELLALTQKILQEQKEI